MTTELEQTTTLPPKAPIDTAARKKRVAALPPASRYPLGAQGQIFVPMAESIQAAGPRAEAMFRDILSTLESAEKVMDTCADAEDAVISSENQLRQGANADVGRLAMVDGRVSSIPGRYDELARAMGPAIDKEITNLDARIKRHNDHMLAMLAEMDAALVCNSTEGDKNLKAQVREHMLTLTKPQRKAFMSKAATEGDLVAIHTILTSPAYLMGIAATDIGDFRDTARNCFRQRLFHP